jgi:hemicentin
VLTGDCHNKTIDPGFSTYRLIAAASNGQVFNLKKKDVNQVLKFVEESVRANKVNILSIDIQEASTKSFAIPIDSTLDRVTVSLSGQDANLVIRDPDGTIVTTATGLQKLLTLKTAVSVAVRRPRAGKWNVTVRCNGSFALRVAGLSPVNFFFGFSLTVIDQMQNLLKRPAAGELKTTLMVFNTKLICVLETNTPCFAKRLSISLLRNF